jgi:hypothetical protein
VVRPVRPRPCGAAALKEELPMSRRTPFARPQVPALVLTLAAAIVALACASRPAQALPLFARKYGVSCTTCHYAVPHLNVFGMHFKQNGYRMPGASGESPWDSTSKSLIPLSVVANVAYHYTSTNTDLGGGNHERTNFGTFEQEQVEFHSAGTLAPRVTFHVDNNFQGAGGVLLGGMAFAQLDDVAKDGALNVKVGIYDADIPYLADSRKTSLTGYLSPVTLGGEGVELNGTRNGWMYAGGLINSSRDPDTVAAYKPDTKTFNQLEDVYVWVTREFSSAMVTGRVLLDQQNPRKLNATSAQHVQGELSAYWERPRFTFTPGVTYETFADMPTGVSDKLETGLLEALWLLDKDSRWLLTTRIEHQYVPKSNGSASVMDRSQAVLNLAYYVNPNARLGIDWAHASDNVHGPVTDDVKAFVWVGY